MRKNILSTLLMFGIISPVFLSAQTPQVAEPALQPVQEKVPGAIGEPRFQERRAVLAPIPESAMSDEEQARARQFLVDLIPEINAVLTDLENENPRAFLRELRRASREMQMLKRQKKRGGEEYENSKKRITLDHKTQMLAYRYQKANDSEKAALKKQMRPLLDQLFDLKEIERERQVQRLEKKLEDLRASLKNRKSNKSRIIEKRMEKLLRIDRDLRW